MHRRRAHRRRTREGLQIRRRPTRFRLITFEIQKKKILLCSEIIKIGNDTEDLLVSLLEKNVYVDFSTHPIANLVWVRSPHRMAPVQD